METKREETTMIMSSVWRTIIGIGHGAIDWNRTTPDTFWGSFGQGASHQNENDQHDEELRKEHKQTLPQVEQDKVAKAMESQRLKEELELVQEELTFTQEELKAAEEEYQNLWGQAGQAKDWSTWRAYQVSQGIGIRPSRAWCQTFQSWLSALKSPVPRLPRKQRRCEKRLTTSLWLFKDAWPCRTSLKKVNSAEPKSYLP